MPYWEHFMAAVADLPVNLSENAVERILELGVWPQFKLMLEHTKLSVAGLRSISVSVDEHAAEEDSSILILAAVDVFTVSAPGKADESTEWRWDR